MLKAIVLVALALTAVTADTSKTPTKDFIDGFLSGLGSKNPSGPCSKAMVALTNAVYTVVADFESKDQNLADVISDLNGAQAMVTAVENSYASCNLGSLEGQVKKIFAAGGWEILVQNYLANGQAIFTDYQQIENCSSNYYECGYASGDAFEKLVGWSLNKNS